MTPGLIEILLVVLVFIVVGPRRIADLVRSMGRGVHDFVDNLGGEKNQKELPGEEKDAERKPEE